MSQTSDKIIVRRGQNAVDTLGLFGYAEVERSDDPLDVDMHFWPLDADHVLDAELTCDCRPKIEMQWYEGPRLIIHQKTN